MEEGEELRSEWRNLLDSERYGDFERTRRVQRERETTVTQFGHLVINASSDWQPEKLTEEGINIACKD